MKKMKRKMVAEWPHRRRKMKKKKGNFGWGLQPPLQPERKREALV